MIINLFVLISWCICTIICYYLIGPIQNKIIRLILILFLCILLTYFSCQNLPKSDVKSLFVVALCWLTSIRLIDLNVFSREKVLTFESLLFKICWTFFPILPSKSVQNQWPIKYHLILILFKLLINHWNYQWTINCQTDINSGRILMFYISLTTISYIFDIQLVFIRILTRNQYTMETFTDFPIFSLSLREFWGRRYNRFVNRILKESIFEPIRIEFSSSTIGGLTTFLISGLLHVHLNYVIFEYSSSIFQIFLFFLLHGLACSIEANFNLKFEEHVGWVLTHSFLLLTAPLAIGPYIKQDSLFFVLHPPPLFNLKWIPMLPIPNFCPQ